MNLEPVRAVLDRASDQGRIMRFWWRDDDAVAGSPALDRLLALAREAGVHLAIAAIPERLQPSLPARLGEQPGHRILVHGLAHRNHARPGRKPAEFGADRPLDVLISDAASGLAKVRSATGDLLLPVFVPPWNRMASALAGALHDIGYVGHSTFGPVRGQQAPSQVNTHLDPVDWRGSRSAAEPQALADALERALTDSDPGPVGLLTHHLMFDEALWTLTSELLALVLQHPAVQVPAVETLWRSGQRHCTVTSLVT